MELDELHYQIEKLCKDGKFEGLLFMGLKNKGYIIRIVCGDATDAVIAAVMTPMWDYKEIELVKKISVKNFGEFKKMMEQN